MAFLNSGFSGFNPAKMPPQELRARCLSPRAPSGNRHFKGKVCSSNRLSVSVVTTLLLSHPLSPRQIKNIHQHSMPMDIPISYM